MKRPRFAAGVPGLFYENGSLGFYLSQYPIDTRKTELPLTILGIAHLVGFLLAPSRVRQILIDFGSCNSH